MAFRELHVVEVREILRRWQRGDSLRSIAAALGADRKTVRRYVEAAKRLGLSREPDGRPVDDDLVSELIAAIQPGAPPRIGEMRRRCRTHSELIEGWVREGCKVPKIARLLKRHAGVSVPERTLNRFIDELRLVPALLRPPQAPSPPRQGARVQMPCASELADREPGRLVLINGTSSPRPPPAVPARGP